MRWLFVVLAACRPVTWADVSVRPSAFDRDHDAWYVEIRAPAPFSYSGYVCGDQPFELTIDRLCTEETVLTGEVWRMPDRSHCGEPPPSWGHFDAQLEGGVRVAVLHPRRIFRGTSLDECDVPRPETITMWPPTKPIAGWRTDTYWTAPEDDEYELLAK